MSPMIKITILALLIYTHFTTTARDSQSALVMKSLYVQRPVKRDYVFDVVSYA